MKWGLIGYGSIGKKHADNIISLEDEVIVVTKNKDCSLPKATSIAELIKENTPEIILISNETSLHVQAYKEVRKLSKTLPILIEKPLFEKRYNITPEPYTFVAYCLRFHPLVTEIKKRIKDLEIISASFYVGQYLPTWRPGRDYRLSYSASKDLGGGVLRDLSHELDLANYLLGDLQLEFCKNKKISNLDIFSDDFFAGFFKTKTCENVFIEMNYLDHITQRYCTIHTNEMTIKLDFIRLEITTNQTVEKFDINKNQMYLTMLKDMRNQHYNEFASFDDGLRILDIISQAEGMQK